MHAYSLPIDVEMSEKAASPTHPSFLLLILEEPAAAGAAVAGFVATVVFVVVSGASGCLQSSVFADANWRSGPMVLWGGTGNGTETFAVLQRFSFPD